MTIPQALELALQHRQSGQLAEAEAILRQIEAIPSLDRDSWHQLGITAHQAGWTDAAVAFFRQALALAPKSAVLHANLGHLLTVQGHLDQAIASCRRAIDLQPDYAMAQNNLGNALGAKGQMADAIEAYRAAIQFKHDYAEAYNNLGNILTQADRAQEAEAAYRRALELKPDYANACHNLAKMLGEEGRVDEAIVAAQRAVDLDPAHAMARMNLGTLYLLGGDFEQGWPLYEARWHASDFTSPQREFSQPLWDGRALNGQRMLLHAEQGFGDSIQFVRYAPLVAQRGGTVIVECPRSLADLFATVRGVSHVVFAGDPLPPFDWHSPLLSLPIAFQTTLPTIPSAKSYLSPSLTRCQTWREWLGDDDTRLKVGLVWAGRATHNRDRQRSLTLRQLLPILSVPEVDFVNLQMDDRAQQIRQLPAASKIRDARGRIGDFADTAALVAQLDLVIAVDTAVAHLAGALGRPVWVLLPFAPDWRWMLQREDSPWYPTMRLFRQSEIEGWEPVVASVREQLFFLVQSRL